MPKKELIYLKCPRKKLMKLPNKTKVMCNNVWQYNGQAVRRTVCPRCGTTVNIINNCITEKEYIKIKASG